MGFRITEKILSRKNRGKSDVEAGQMVKLGEIGDEVHLGLDLTVQNRGDKEFRVLSAEIRELNGNRVVQRGTVDEVVAEPHDYVHFRPEFTFKSSGTVEEEGNSVILKLRTVCGSSLNTEMIKLEGLEFQD